MSSSTTGIPRIMNSIISLQKKKKRPNVEVILRGGGQIRRDESFWLLHASIYVSTVILITAINCQIRRQIDTNAHITELSPKYAKLNFTILALFFILSLGSKGCMSKHVWRREIRTGIREVPTCIVCIILICECIFI